MGLSNELGSVKGVGPVVATKLATLGVGNVEQLLENFPRRYDDYSRVDAIKSLRPGMVTIKAIIKQVTGRYVRRGMHITEAVASDETGSVRLVWFNQSYRAGAIKPDQEYFIRGNFGLSYQKLSIQSPSMELVSDFPLNTARIIPVYRLTKGLKSVQISKIVRSLIPEIDLLEETLPQWIVEEKELVSRAQAVKAIHFPDSPEELEQAKRRLGFEEVFGLTLAALINKYEFSKESAVKVPFKEAIAKDFVDSLPFKLTDAQRKVAWQIYKDLEAKHPMNRLVEGDVGSGKTVLACMAAVMVMDAGMQVALMAPTEILAQQHADSVSKTLAPMKLKKKVALLKGKMKPSAKQTVLEKIKNGDAQFVIGTHALIQEKVDMHKLGLIIIDEQHRFGVEQRKKLQLKAGHMPHVLALTATPIPRSLALTLYGELDVSILDQKPAGRKPIITKTVSPNSRAQMYKRLEGQLEKGNQVFVVCPLITDSDKSDTLSAEKVHKELSTKHFASRSVGLLHGRMKQDEKDQVMKDFVDKNIDILVSTTVIEVGVDVPSASVMVIENAERFGLAQIHQLRGRVGRSDQQSYCFLVLGDSKPPSKRLRALESSTDGFALAELDLELRGPGAIYGTSQHGELDLRIAKLSDHKLIAEARGSAQEFIERAENLIDYTELNARVTNLRKVTNLN